jgi:hypothetical protein
MEGDVPHVTTAIMDLTTLMRSHHRAGEMNKKKKRRETKQHANLILLVPSFYSLFSPRPLFYCLISGTSWMLLFIFIIPLLSLKLMMSLHS